MRFEFDENAEASAADNNGHVVRRVNLYLPDESNSGDHGGFDGEEVGYINATYVPSEVWRERYTGDWGLLRWGSDFHGWCGFLDPLADDEFYPLSSVVRSLAKKTMRRSEHLTKEEVQEMSESELEERFEFYIEKLHDEFDDQREETKQFHVDKPRVEFIRVARGYRRNGYGTALYRRMTEELGRRYGLSLYASQLQRDCASAAWEKLITLDWNDATEEQIPFEGDGSTRYKLTFAKAVA